MIGALAGNAIADIEAIFTAFLVYELAFDDKSLSDMRKTKVVVQFGSDPNSAVFNPAMVRRIDNDKIGLFTVLKVQFDVMKKSGLIVFNGKMVVGFAVDYQVVGNVALG